MHIRRALPADRDRLLDIWLRSVRATHSFVSEEEIQTMIPHVRDYLTSEATDLWAACIDAQTIGGFMGMAGNKMESLFLVPEQQRRGLGRQMIHHAYLTYGELTTDVNEQNTDARRFYEACGFVVEGRSELDDQGRPHPLLHLRLTNPAALQPRPGNYGSPNI